VTAALDVAPHLRAARRALLYLVVGLGQGLTYLLVVGGGLVLGVLLAPLWVGLPLLAGTARLAWRLARASAARPTGCWRRTCRRSRRRRRGSRVRELFGTGALWRVLAMLLLKLPVVAARAGAGRAPVAAGDRARRARVSGLAGDDGRLVGPWALGPAVGIALCLLALPADDRLDRRARGHRRGAARARPRAAAPREAEGGPVRELLAERLGDRSLNIAYWLPEREIFVDDAGRQVDAARPGSGAPWTAVERDGVRVAAIVHDAELDASPELVTAAASAAALAIDNERLKAELRARVEELRVSRLRIVEAADDARRRIERDLHDGAQQQLVSLALDLRMLKARLGDSGLAGTGRRDRREARGGARELREFARGIHPAFLSERGVGAAVEALVARAPLDVEADVELASAARPGRGRRLLRRRRGADERRPLRRDPNAWVTSAARWRVLVSSATTARAARTIAAARLTTA
jgi:hypothetical protein